MIGWAAALLPTAWRELLPYRLPFAYLQMPLLYAFAVSLCFPARRSVRHLIAGIVAALACAITLVPLPEGVASSQLPGSGINRVVNRADESRAGKRCVSHCRYG